MVAYLSTLPSLLLAWRHGPVVGHVVLQPWRVLIVGNLICSRSDPSTRAFRGCGSRLTRRHVTPPCTFPSRTKLEEGGNDKVRGPWGNEVAPACRVFDSDKVDPGNQHVSQSFICRSTTSTTFIEVFWVHKAGSVES